MPESTPETAQQITTRLKAEARRLGFGLQGVAPAVTPPGIDRFRSWLSAGYAGEMHYLPRRAAAYEHPTSVLEGVRTILMLGMHYPAGREAPFETGQGMVAAYARGSVDYHDLIHDRLKELANRFREWVPGAAVRGVVDTAPLLEREFAQLAGLGWIGKNTMLLNRDSGSYFFLAALLTSFELVVDVPHSADHCGTCTACLDACPTTAFPAPYELDARRCISYLTIELREPIARELRPQLGDWVFGCDVCQQVCPWNRRAPGSDEEALQPQDELTAVPLANLFSLSDDDFRALYRQTPLWRSKRRGILRNAALALGNQADQRAVPVLRQGLADPEPLVRGASAWALGQIGGRLAERSLRERLMDESDADVSGELRLALREIAPDEEKAL